MSETLAVALDISRVVEGVRHASGKPPPLTLHEPEFSGNEKRYLIECIDSTFVSSVGEFVNRFERMLSDITGTGHAIACVNGTAALQVCLQLAGVRQNDEVIMPALTFVATANSAVFSGAIPHFVDSETLTLGLSAKALASRLGEIGELTASGVRNAETGRRIAAVVPMHTFGHPVDLDQLVAIAAEWNLPIVEDATESLGTLYRGRHTGTFGLLGALSFNGNKIITTGGGGAILTNDTELARRAKHLTTTAKTEHRWAFNHDRVGYNYRLPNLNAALGCAQLEQLDRFVASKRRLADFYRQQFDGVHGVRVFLEPQHARSNYWLNTLLLDEDCAEQRDGLLAALNDAGLMARPAWTPLHRLPMYRDCPRGPLNIAEDLACRIVNVPSSAQLADG